MVVSSSVATIGRWIMVSDGLGLPVRPQISGVV
jgi:hypothetical protein